MTAPRRPNILLVTTDQHRHDHIGLAGLRGVATPNLDRLGREGVHFRRGYTVSPLCTPARVSLLTGQFPSVHGAYSVGVEADPFPRPLFTAALSEAGYRTAVLGKTHFVPRPREEAHVAGRPDPDPDFWRSFDGPYLGFDFVRASIGHTTNTTPNMHYRVFLEDAGVPYAEWFPDVDGRHDHDAAGAWNIPPEYHDTAWVGGLTEQYVRDAADSDAPWFCWASFQDPHEPFVCPEPYYSAVDMEAVELFEDMRPGEFDDKPDWYGRALSGEWGDMDDGRGVPCVSRRAPIHEQRQAEALRATLGMVAFIDERVGRILDALEETGQAENTVVVFTSDHGELHGRHGLWHKGLAPYDDVQRVPFLTWGPGTVAPRGGTDALASLVDLPRTILSLAGVDIPQSMQGTDLTPVLRGDAETAQDAVLVEMEPTTNIFQQTLVTERHKLVVYRDDDAGELYDLDADPDQYVNLWDHPDCADLRREMLHRMARTRMGQRGEVRPRISFA